MNADTESLPNAMTRVTILVHGVGDADAYELLSRVDLGYSGRDESAFPSITAGLNSQSRNTSLISNAGASMPALVLPESAGEHWIIPFVWSGSRVRVAKYLPELVGKSDIVTLVGPNILRILEDVVSSTWLCVDFAAIPWNILLIVVTWLLGVAAFAAVGVVLFLVAGAIFVLAALVVFYWREMPKGSASVRLFLPLFGWLVGLGTAVVCRLCLAVAWFFSLYDFIGDVCMWVSDPERREARVTELRDLLAVVSQQFPRDARITVLGHSLGSVLATHALCDWHFNRQVVLGTIGSPLKTLSVIFPSAVSSPLGLLNNPEFRSNIIRWWNSWRDQDVIGRSLGTASVGVYHEVALGSGFHGDYWRDPRMWAVAANQAARFQESDLPIWTTLKTVELGILSLLALVAPVGAIMGLFTCLTTWTTYLSDWHIWSILGPTAALAYLLALIQGLAVLLWTAASFATARSLCWERRTRLNHLRGWLFPLAAAGVLITATTASIYSLLWAFVR